MKFNNPFSFTFSILLVVFLLKLSSTVNGSSDQKLSRIKRKVMFRKNSKLFVRLNGKSGIVNASDIFAHGWGFRINYELPDNIPKRHQFFRRDLKNEGRNPRDGSNRHSQAMSCMLSYLGRVATALGTTDNCGFLCGIGNIINRSQGSEAFFFKQFIEDCDGHADRCPLMA